MPLGLIFWVIMLVWLLFHGAVQIGLVGGAWGRADSVILFVLFLLLGWKVFGSPVQS